MFKKPSLIQNYSHHYSLDPAFDHDAEGFDHARFVETGDLQFLPAREGGPPPTTFELRPLTQKEKMYCQAKAREGPAMIAWWGVAISLQGATPMVVDDKPHEIARVQDGSVVRVCDADMELLGSVDDGALLIELADRVWSEAIAAGK